MSVPVFLVIITTMMMILAATLCRHLRRMPDIDEFGVQMKAIFGCCRKTRKH
jgi:hypothetical protein